MINSHINRKLISCLICGREGYDRIIRVRNASRKTIEIVVGGGFTMFCSDFVSLSKSSCFHYIMKFFYEPHVIIINSCFVYNVCLPPDCHFLFHIM